MNRNRIIALIGLATLSIALCVKASTAPASVTRAQGGPTQLLDAGGVNRASINSSGELLVHPTTGYATSAKQDSLIALVPSALDTNNLRVAVENTPAVTVSGTVTTSTSAPSSIFPGQKKVAVTGTAVVIGSSQALAQGLLITASPGNVADIYLGDSGVNNTAAPAGNGYRLMPGQSVKVAGNNVNLFYINGTANDFVTWIGN